MNIWGHLYTPAYQMVPRGVGGGGGVPQKYAPPPPPPPPPPPRVHQNYGPYINDFKQTVYRISIKVPSVTKNSKNQMLWHFRLQLQNPKQLISFFAHLQLRHLLLLHWETAANVTSLSKQSIVFQLNFKFPPVNPPFPWFLLWRSFLQQWIPPYPSRLIRCPQQMLE